MLAISHANDNPEFHQVKVEIVPCLLEHVNELAETIRDADRAECESYGFSAKEGLWQSYENGLGNTCALINGKVAAIWGCCGTYLGEVGQPWLLTSNEVYKVSPLKFAKVYQKEVRKMLELFPLLENYVAVEYDEAVRLLSIVGFTIGEPEKYGLGMFRKFSKAKK